MSQNKRLVRKADSAYKNPELFNSALNIANALFKLGHSWDSIENILITRIKPYTFSHPDLDLVHTQLNRMHGRSIV